MQYVVQRITSNQRNYTWICLKRSHEVFMEMVIKEEIVIKRQAYIKVFGNLIAITPSEVILFIVALVFYAIILYIIFDYCNKS